GLYGGDKAEEIGGRRWAGPRAIGDGHVHRGCDRACGALLDIELRVAEGIEACLARTAAAQRHHGRPELHGGRSTEAVAEDVDRETATRWTLAGTQGIDLRDHGHVESEFVRRVERAGSDRRGHRDVDRRERCSARTG